VKIIYTKHAKEMLIFRKIPKSLADQCAMNPDQTLPTRQGKKIYLKDFGENYLKLVIAHEEDILIIVTLHWLAKRRAKG